MYVLLTWVLSTVVSFTINTVYRVEYGPAVLLSIATICVQRTIDQMIRHHVLSNIFCFRVWNEIKVFQLILEEMRFVLTMLNCVNFRLKVSSFRMDQFVDLNISMLKVHCRNPSAGNKKCDHWL